jgi:metal-dependent hydrolase (beta-lactamase superfamily II)
VTHTARSCSILLLLLLPGKGVVVLSACSHAGIVNVMRDVQVSHTGVE